MLFFSSKAGQFPAFQNTRHPAILIHAEYWRLEANFSFFVGQENPRDVECKILCISHEEGSDPYVKAIPRHCFDTSQFGTSM